MTQPDQPQFYLITPEAFELSFAATLARILDAVPIACVRLDLATRDDDTIARAADALREVTHARDVALVLSGATELAERLGLDGVHLGPGQPVRAARKALGPDAIVGAYSGASRHDGLTAGEAGADYIAFDAAETEIFTWWSDMIELPVVAEKALTTERIETLAPVTDFFGIGDEIWSNTDPLAALNDLTAPLR
ncbi:MAG: thiamine phosphate synthase [Pseudomonadota bacterium]